MLVGFLVISFVLVTLLWFNSALSKLRFWSARVTYDYDVIITGGSICGPVLAKALADQGRKVLLVERSLYTRPDRIIGELLQPGGLNALKEVSMESCALEAGMPCVGYVVVDDDGKVVALPYRDGFRGVSFHFGDFVQNLRRFVFRHCKEQVQMVEGTVTEVLTEHALCFERAYGIKYTASKQQGNHLHDDPFAPDGTNGVSSTSTSTISANANSEVVSHIATAPLVVMCDGGMSKWKSRYQHYSPAKEYSLHFIGLVLRNVTLPMEQHGTVFFGKSAPILAYRLDPNELRMLIIYNGPQLPSLQEQSKWMLRDVAPFLPANMREEFTRVASKVENIRSMPVACYSPTFPSIRGYVGIGDHNNQRNPLTGGGMTCAFRDALRLAHNLSSIPSMRSPSEHVMAQIEEAIHGAVVDYARDRYKHSCCINLLSWALHSVFSDLKLRKACFDYFLRGGECVRGPMDLLAGVDTSLTTLVYHYTKVSLLGIWSVMTQNGALNAQQRTVHDGKGNTWLNVLYFFADWPRIKHAFYILFEAIHITIPLVILEFVSLWRLIDPTSAIALIVKRIRTIICVKYFNGKQGKPVGL